MKRVCFTLDEDSIKKIKKLAKKEKMSASHFIRMVIEQWKK